MTMWDESPQLSKKGVDNQATCSHFEHMARQAPQPLMYRRGLCCPHHGHQSPSMQCDTPGTFECPECHRIFIQRRYGMTFDVTNEPDEP